MADLRITDLPALTAALLQATDPLAIADTSASETKKITAKDLVQSAVALIDDGSIPSAKVSVAIAPGTIGTTELADNAVTDAKLADSSSATLQSGLPASGAYIGQLAVDTATNKASIWDGSAWVAFKAAGSINSITGDTSGVVRVTASQSGDSVTLATYLADATEARQVLIGPTNTTGAVQLRQLIGTDLPLATTTSIGAVQVNGSGLAMSGDQIVIDNSVTPTEGTSVYGVVEYDASGLVTSGRAITSADLPRASTGNPGAIQPGTDFTIGVNGTLNHSNSVSPGTGTKVSYNASGLITSSSVLTENDVPALPASKITSGTFPTERIADRSITDLKLADYATSYIQDTQPAGTNHFHGQLWLNPLAQQIRMWDGNVWVPIGVGALAEQNLRFCGLFDATNGHITVLTTFGVEAGFNVGDVIPTATAQLTGAYFVSETSGNGTGVTPGVTYDPGDWCVCLGVAQGWQRIDTLNGGGGGGGSLDSLADVTITTPGAGQVLTYDGSFWINQTPVSASETVKGIIQLATNAEVQTGTDALKAITPKTLADNYLAKNIANLPALP